MVMKQTCDNCKFGYWIKYKDNLKLIDKLLSPKCKGCAPIEGDNHWQSKDGISGGCTGTGVH